MFFQGCSLCDDSAASPLIITTPSLIRFPLFSIKASQRPDATPTVCRLLFPPHLTLQSLGQKKMNAINLKRYNLLVPLV